MTGIGAWPTRRVLWNSVAWIIVVAAVIAATGIMAAQSLPADDSGMAGLSIAPGRGPLLALVLLGPPACLLVVWAIRRKQHR